MNLILQCLAHYRQFKKSEVRYRAPIIAKSISRCKSIPVHIHRHILPRRKRAYTIYRVIKIRTVAIGSRVGGVAESGETGRVRRRSYSHRGHSLSSRWIVRAFARECLRRWLVRSRVNRSRRCSRERDGARWCAREPSTAARRRRVDELSREIERAREPGNVGARTAVLG